MIKKFKKNSIGLKMMDYIKLNKLYVNIIKYNSKIKSWTEFNKLLIKWLKNLVKLIEKLKVLNI